MKPPQQTLKRLLVLIIGLAVVDLVVVDIYPIVHRRVPFSIAIFVVYLILAYVLLPGAVRFYRILFPPRHLPVYSVTPDGFASDPINIAIIGSRQDIITAMEAAGWHLADPRHLHYLLRYVLAMFFNHRYDNAPLSYLYLFGRRQDLGFEILIDGVHARHHVRFWATSYDPSKPLSVQRISWRDRSAHQIRNNMVWVGAASLDKGLAPIRHNMQITHMIHPDTNQERDLIVSHLSKAGLVEKIDHIKLWNPYRLVNRAWRGYLLTDGQMAVITLKSKEKLWSDETPAKPRLKRSPRARQSATAID